MTSYKMEKKVNDGGQPHSLLYQDQSRSIVNNPNNFTTRATEVDVLNSTAPNVHIFNSMGNTHYNSDILQDLSSTVY